MKTIFTRMEGLLEAVTGPVPALATNPRLEKMAQEICVALHNQLPPDPKIATDELVAVLKKLVSNKQLILKSMKRMTMPGRALSVARKATRALVPGQARSTY